MTTPETSAPDHVDGYATQGIGGWAEYSAWATPIDDPVYYHSVVVPSMKVIPVIFLPGIMGSNLRMSKQRQKDLNLPDNRAWRPEDFGAELLKMGLNEYTDRLKNADARRRQKNFDPNETEVEYYTYTSNNDMFDPEGAETLAADARHSNIPDSFADIPPLLTAGPPPPQDAPWHIRERKVENAAQKARWRGWSEIFFKGAYGDLLMELEQRLNNIFVHMGTPHMALSPLWKNVVRTEAGSVLTDGQGRQMQSGQADPLALLDVSPQKMGASQGPPISAAQLESINVHGRGPLWFPVHAMGYNWLQSNGDAARVLAERITGLIDGYKKRGFQCEKVVLVTHSMGGLVARALIHPDYGNLQEKVLGIYHGAMPTHGAAAAYKRIRCGFEKSGMPIASGITQQILGKTGKNVTAIMANSPGCLELLPNELYGSGWLKVLAADGKTVLASWPGKDSLSASQQAQYRALEQYPIAPYSSQHDTHLALRHRMAAPQSIYKQPDRAWWRLFNSDWVNPANGQGGGMKETCKRINDAAKFHEKIAKTFHPVTVSSYCASPWQKSYGEVIWKIDASGEGNLPLRPEDGLPIDWTLVSEDGEGRVVVRTPAGRQLTLRMQEPEQDGDATVAAERSARHVSGLQFVHGRAPNNAHYDHQDSYGNKEVQASVLWSLIQMTLITIEQQWWKKKS